MDINKNNYESFLLDLFEGRLSAEDQQKVRAFLVLNPDCSANLLGDEPWMLEAEKIRFPGKEQLKKEFPDASFKLTEGNFDLFSIARMEGDLTAEQEMEHASMVEKDEGKSRRWNEWQQTKLEVPSVSYQGKENLKRKLETKTRVVWISALSVAAAIALLFILLRVEPVDSNTAVELSVQSPAIESQTSTTPEAEITPGSNVIQEEISGKTTEETPLAVVDEPVMFSIKRDSGRPIETVGKSDSLERASPGLVQPKPDKVLPRPVRIAEVVSGTSNQVAQAEQDRIKPLDIPPSRIHMSSLSINQVKELNLKEAIDGYTREKDISVWSIANAGINGLNRMTGSEISLLAARDEDGKVSGFRFKTRLLSVTSPVDRSQ